MNVHFLSPLSTSDGELIRRAFKENNTALPAITSGEDFPETITCLVGGRPDAALLDDHRELEQLVIPWVGPPASTIELITQRPHIRLYNIHHNAVPVAEMALALLMSAARRIVWRDGQLRRGIWDGSTDSPGTILRGKTACVLGYGAIVQELAPVLRALGIAPRFVRRSSSLDPEIYTAGNLHQALEGAHVLINTLPLTGETRGLIGAAELKLLARDAIVVNVGRGKVIDEAALYDALESGILQSAGLDVWYQYPNDDGGRNSKQLPSEYPFHKLKNVVMSPHIGGEWPNPEVQEMRINHIAKLLVKFARGESVSEMDISRGY